MDPIQFFLMSSHKKINVASQINLVKIDFIMGFPGGSDGKESACNAGDLGLIPGSGRTPGKGNGYPLQYSCPEKPMDRGAWRATAHAVTKSWTRLRDYRQTIGQVSWTDPNFFHLNYHGICAY